MYSDMVEKLRNLSLSTKKEKKYNHISDNEVNLYKGDFKSATL
jgi:hypothetical protein